MILIHSLNKKTETNPTMKNYFDFTLTGRKLFPYWILFFIVFYVPYLFIAFKLKSFSGAPSASALYVALIYLLLALGFLVVYFFIKLTIEGIAYRGKNLTFHGSFGRFAGVYFLGLFLTIITLGIYYAWFVRDITKFFADNSSYESEKLNFRGKGSDLFVIMLLSLVIPMIILMVVLGIVIFRMPVLITSLTLMLYIIILILSIPFFYLFYKWMVNVGYKGYQISWETKFWPSTGKIALEFFLILITLGLYGPLAMFRLYKYFALRTTAVSGETVRRFDYDADNFNDFLFAWGQILLSVVTLMIYYPWACCKIGKRVLGKTSIE